MSSSRVGCTLAVLLAVPLLIALALDAPPTLLILFPGLWLVLTVAISRRLKRADRDWQATFFDDHVEVQGINFLTLAEAPAQWEIRYADVAHVERENGVIHLIPRSGELRNSVQCPVPPEQLDALWRDLLQWLEATSSARMRSVAEEGRIRFLPAGAGLEQLAPGRRVQGAWSLGYAGSDRFKVLSSEGGGVLAELKLEHPAYNKGEGLYTDWEARSPDGALLARSNSRSNYIRIRDEQNLELARVTNSHPEGGGTRLEISTPDGLFIAQGNDSVLTLEKDGVVQGSFERDWGEGFRQGKMEHAVSYMAFVIIMGALQGASTWR
ncbi:hypothetical protein [Hyalangium sp.]|uniref:hypothetical protein n=1 Tax=Hyalangium sp. TaxID=2028555 RepID=UPI002D64413E|nr:hypothetical protein [Hyalangium sp.]HYH99331.1 hypothetical protein [Hyalangium sp.]